MKQCKKCLQSKSLSEFYHNARSKDGFTCRCKICFKQDTRKSREANYQSDYFKNASPISKVSIYRHGLNALRVYEKYKKKCAYCGQDWDLTIHHLDGNGRNKLNENKDANNELDNLILICRRCHGSIHGKQRWSKRK